MILTFLLLLLFSNGLSNRSHTSILYGRIGILTVFYSIISTYTTLYITYLEKGIGLCGGLFNITGVTQIFQIFILIIINIVFYTMAFYPKKNFFGRFNTNIIFKKVKEIWCYFYSIKNDIKLFILFVIILDIIVFYQYYYDSEKALVCAFIILMHTPLIYFSILNGNMHSTIHEESLLDKIRKLIFIFLLDPLYFIRLFFILFFLCFIIKQPFFTLLEVNPVNIPVTAAIILGVYLPSLTIINMYTQLETYLMFDYNLLLKFLLQTINIKNIKHLILLIILVSMCKIFIFFFFFHFMLDFFVITKSSGGILNMRISDLLNPANPNASNQGVGPQAQPPQPPQPTIVPAPVSTNSQGTEDDTQATVVSVSSQGAGVSTQATTVPLQAIAPLAVNIPASEEFARILENDLQHFHTPQRRRPTLRDLGYRIKGEPIDRANVLLRFFLVHRPDLFPHSNICSTKRITPWFIQRIRDTNLDIHPSSVFYNRFRN